MAYLGIGETQLQILDNEQNRNIVMVVGEMPSMTHVCG